MELYRHTAHLSSDEITLRRVLSASWEIPATYLAEPQRVFFGQIGPESSKIEREVRITRADSKPFAIKALIASNPAFKVARASNEEDVKRTHVIFVTLDPEKLDQTVWATMTVSSDDKHDDEISVPLSAMR